MGLCISAGCQKRLGKPYKGELGSAVGGESLPNALFRQYLIRHEAEAVGGLGDQALGNIQSCRTVRQEAGKATDTGGLDMVGEEIALIDGKAAESIHRAVRAQNGHGEQNRPFRGVGTSLSGSFPILISPSGEEMHFQRSRSGEGVPFLSNDRDSIELLRSYG